MRAALVASVFPAAAAAQGPARVAYDAPEGCPSVEGFTAALRARGVEITGASPALAVAIRRGEGGVTGSLRIGEAGAAGPREVSGANCGEVVDALAAVASLALRPALVAGAEERPVVPPPEMVVDREIAFTVSGGLASGFLPHKPVGRVELSVERNYTLGITGSGPRFTTPSLRFSLGLLGGGGYRWGANTVDFTAQTIGLGGCSPLLLYPQGLSIFACAQVSAGLAGIATTSDDGRRTDRNTGWGAAGFGARLRYAVGSRFHAALGLGGDARVGPLEAESPDGQRRSVASAVSFYGQLGAGLRFLVITGAPPCH